MSVDLHTTHDVFHSFPKPYGSRRITHQALYTCLMSTTHYFSDVRFSSHVKYFQQYELRTTTSSVPGSSSGQFAFKAMMSDH